MEIIPLITSPTVLMVSVKISAGTPLAIKMPLSASSKLVFLIVF